MTNYVYEVRVNDYSAGLAKSFKIAMHRTLSEERLDTALSFPNQFGLDTPELAGSEYHRIRYEVQGERHESMVITTHDLDIENPNRETAISSIDLVNDFDPSFQVQAALYNAALTDADISEISSDLGIEISDHVAILHQRFKGAKLKEEAADLVEKFRTAEELYQSTVKLIPATGDPLEILDSLDEKAQAEFERLAALAWPADETPAPRGM